MIYQWYVGYRVGSSYRNKIVYGKTARQAIRNARVQDIRELYKFGTTAIPDTNSMLHVKFDGDFTDDEMASLIHDIAQEIPHKQIYFNDVECRYWTFDYKTHSGLWVQNISYTDSLSVVSCLVQKGV